MPTDLIDVLVIGAGPVGLTLAGELRRHGASVRIVDKKAEPMNHPNAAVVHVRTLEILSAMGAVEGFLKEGYALPGMHVRAFGKRIGFVQISGVESPFPAPRTIGQQITERLLHDHLVGLGGRVERPVEAVGVEQDADETRVRLRHLAEDNREEVARARWVVGCEGSASITRHTLGIAFEGSRYAGKEFLQADARVRWSYPHGFAYEFMTETHVLIFFPYDALGHYRIICARDDQDTENRQPPTLEEMQELVRTHADPGAELYDPVWLNRFRSGHRLAARFKEGRCFLAGDAGHVHVPVGGQGMNYGMHDAFNLGWKLGAVATGKAPPALLDTYMAERHPVDEALIQGTDRGFHFLVNPHVGIRTAMKMLGRTLLSLSFLQERIRNTLAEMNVAYPHSALTEDHGGSTGPAAGERAPDAVVVRMPEQRTIQLFEVMRGTGWTLLLFSGEKPGASELETLERFGASLAPYEKQVGTHLIFGGDGLVPENGTLPVLMDRELYAHAKYGVEPDACLYLIRPDGYVGFRGGLEQRRHLTAYLERVLVPAK